MKTDDLVNFLATGAAADAQPSARRRMAQALLLAVPVSLAIVLLGYGVRPDLSLVMTAPPFWVKLGLPLCLAVAAASTLARLAVPGVALRGAALAVAAPVLLLWTLGMLSWFSLPQPERLPALLGQSWRSCPWSIALIASPIFVATLLALRQLAPTRPAGAGAAAGALAGGIGATLYALHCVELTLPFLAVWYVLGMLIPVLAGAWLGPRLLRW